LLCDDVVNTAHVTLPPLHVGRKGTIRDRLVPVMGLLGVGLLFYLIAELGPTRIVAQLHGLATLLPAVLAMTGAKYCLQTTGWRFMLAPELRPSWGQSISATITGDAVGYLTWAGPFTGEPVRALLIRGAVPVAAGTAAGAIERAMYNVTAGVLVWGVLLWLAATAYALWLVAALLSSIVAILVGAAILRRRWREPSAPTEAARAHTRRRSSVSVLVGAGRTLWRERRHVLPTLALIGLAQHALLVAEAYLILGALAGASSLPTALVFEAVTKVVNTAGLVVPARIGVSEGGSALLADALGFAASHGLSLALMRRVRALIWALVGLALLPFQEARARRAQSHTAAHE
jgi:Lysylphosphatidylglycerol synthase TM region